MAGSEPDVAGLRATARYDVSEMLHQVLDGDAVLRSPGPLWFLVLDGAARLRTPTGALTVGAGDAVWLDARTAFTVEAVRNSDLVVADLRVFGATHPMPSPLVVRNFRSRHPGVAELVRACPLDSGCRLSAFAEGYGALIGAAMTESWLTDQTVDPEAADPLVRRVLEAVSADPAGSWSVDSLASLVHLSRSALTARFQKALGRSPVRTLREVRMGHARELLRNRALPIEVVASRCGYGSLAAFSRAFTAEHGSSPQAWRADVLQERGPRRTANAAPLIAAQTAPSSKVAATP
jgi:AraC-like DNA-binding protein